MKINKIVVRNFKSLKYCDTELGEFNILIGPNGSGKSNFIEIFELLRSIYVGYTQNPFLKWWGYDHVVWNKDEKLNISFEICFSEKDYIITFYTEFTGIGGNFKIIKETIKINKVLTISNTGKTIHIEYDDNYFKKILDLEKNIPSYMRHDEPLKSQIRKAYSIEMSDRGLHQNNIFNRLDKIMQRPRRMQREKKYTYYSLYKYPEDVFKDTEKEKIILIFPNIERTHLVKYIVKNINQFFQAPVLQRLNFEQMKNPFRVSNDMDIKNDASNFCVVLYNLFLKDNRVPNIINRFIYEIFPDFKLLFKASTDGRIFITLKSSETEFYPPSLSDGFFKILALATIIELNPKIIIIDEIEDSLFARIIELFISIVKENKIQLLISTHSPYVVDIAEPNDLLIFSNSSNISTSICKFKSPNLIREELNRLKITLSEKWLFSSDNDLE